MRFSEAWLREWVSPEISTQELADQLTMAGLEVDSITPAAPVFTGVVVGEVLTREAHPDADKLSVCSVNIGADEPVQIVCGAKNVAAGMVVPVATVGAVLGGDFKIKKAKLRGVQSLGMICSATEVGLADSSDGIMPLPADAPIGTDFREYLNLDDQCIEVDLTPDRGDCLSILGVAREVGVINRLPITLPELAPVSAAINDSFTATLSAPAACSRYLCRVIRGINAKASTPDWMVERLRRGDVRAISPVVDVTNYVLMELGQPMHGFDLDKINGDIDVRMAKSSEALTLLDGTEATLKEDTLVIADSEKPLAIAGIMGGEPSSVTDATSNVLLESAFFAPLAIAGKARSYGLHTDSSHRFERGVDFDLQAQAIERATALLLDIVGGEAGPVNEVVSSQDLPVRSPILLRSERVGKLLGVEISTDMIAEILERLDMKLEAVDGGWNVVPPSARFDMEIEADLVEEIARIYGYNNIPASLNSAPVSITSKPEAGFSLIRAKQILVDRQYQEAITYSFLSPEMSDLVMPGAEHIKLANPISADMAVMRGSIWPGLLATMQHNIARQQNRVRIFESGLIFQRNNGELKQSAKLAAALCGTATTEQWTTETRKVDFFDLKADLEAVFSLLGDMSEFEFVASDENSALHPGQAAKILRNGENVGWIGMLHPGLQAKLDLPSVYLFEVDLAGIAMGGIPKFTPLSKFPAIRRDFAVTVDKNVPFSAVLSCAKAASPKIVQDIQLFDVYTGENIDSSVRSLALSLILQESSRTLTDQEVEEAGNKVLAALASDLSAELRN